MTTQAWEFGFFEWFGCCALAQTYTNARAQADLCFNFNFRLLHDMCFFFTCVFRFCFGAWKSYRQIVKLLYATWSLGVALTQSALQSEFHVLKFLHVFNTETFWQRKCEKNVHNSKCIIAMFCIYTKHDAIFNINANRFDDAHI